MAKELATKVEEEKKLAVQAEAPMGFSDDDSADMIIPRVKVIQTLSPERKEKIAEEGDIINSLTKEKLNGKVFIPCFKFSNNIWWKDRNDGGGMRCVARDGKNGEMSDGTRLICAACKRNEFDNTKQGKESFPTCTKYINFFGFFEGERIPVIMSFSRTNYNEGKKLYSLAKVTMQNMWNYGYKITNKLVAKNGNEWHIINATPNGATSAEDREFALNIFKQFNGSTFNFDVDDSAPEAAAAAPVDVEKTEF